MGKSQASKRKRHQIRKFRATRLTTRCSKCGAKLSKGSYIIIFAKNVGIRMKRKKIIDFMFWVIDLVMCFIPPFHFFNTRRF
jgi:hypothetical protein